MKFLLFNIILVIFLIIKIVDCDNDEPPPPCDSEIFCYGRVIDLVMRQHLYEDSKTFVDMKLKKSPEETLQSFDNFIAKVNKPTKAQTLNWVNENFDKKGSELEMHIPKDHKKNFQLLQRIKDEKLRKFARDLNEIWIELSRKMKDEVRDNPQLTSIIYVPNPFIIAGGRFLEFYYWDSYWIIQGLIQSEMFDTIRGMLENFLSVIDRFGLIPNGGRVYYLARSHPPLLCAMIKSYVDATHDYDFAISSINTLESEFEYFANKTVIVRGHSLARYIDHSTGPRPESYREDVIIAEQNFKTQRERNEFYANIKAGAESGMDFSSRWIIDEKGGNEGTLKDIKTRSIIPVDLNALLCMNARILSEFYGYAGYTEKQIEYETKANEIAKAIQAILWNEESGIWHDYDFVSHKPRRFYYPTNLSPLFTKCFDQSKSAEISEKVMNYIDQMELDKYPGGVPNSLMHTGEQWDFPNVWAPMQHLLIVALDNLNSTSSKQLAFKWAERWVQSNLAAFESTGAMYEKYVATEFGASGGGGEYEVQKGFGWSNGAVLDLLNRYGDKMKSTGDDSGPSGAGANKTQLISCWMTILISFVFCRFV